MIIVPEETRVVHLAVDVEVGCLVVVGTQVNGGETLGVGFGGQISEPHPSTLLIWLHMFKD